MMKKNIAEHLMAVKQMCMDNRDGCKGCPFFRKHTGCMFKKKGYPARWDLKEDGDDGTSER